MLISDNGTERTSDAVLYSSGEAKVEWHYIASGCSMQKGYVESFDGRMRDELRNEALLLTLGRRLQHRATTLLASIRRTGGLRCRSRLARGCSAPCRWKLRSVAPCYTSAAARQQHLVSGPGRMKIGGGTSCFVAICLTGGPRGNGTD